MQMTAIQGRVEPPARLQITRPGVSPRRPDPRAEQLGYSCATVHDPSCRNPGQNTPGCVARGYLGAWP